jgi:hypothetical protein
MISTTKNNLHWNYFIALEDDMAQVSRYIEFCKPNLGVFSIELAHLLLSAASEVDVMAKCLCALVDPNAAPSKINLYREVLMQAVNDAKIADLTAIRVAVPRYGIDFRPWENWAIGKTPDWWLSYNHVKHKRDEHFHEATLQHALNALGALFILNYLYYRIELKLDAEVNVGEKRGFYAPSVVFNKLSPGPRFMTLPQDLHRPAKKVT